MTPTVPLARRAAALVGTVLVLVLVAAGCSGGGKKASAGPTSVPKTTTTTEPPTLAPLTGLADDDDARRSRPALMVKVDNTPKGFAVQEGVEKADIVFVEQTEQGTTRLAAVFHSQDAVVGPVRSARTSDVGLAGALNRPLLAYSGANSGVLKQVRNGPLVDVGVDVGAVTGVYVRNQRGGSRNLLRFFLPTSEIYEVKGSEGGAPPPLFTYRSATRQPAGDAVRGVRVGYGGGAATVVSYEWDGAGWARTQNNRVHVMANGGPRISPENVVVLITPYRSSGFRDVTGAVSPEAVLEGSGEAWFLSAGKLVKGQWSRPGPNAAFAFTGADGRSVALTAGRTWIELAPGQGSATVLEPAGPATPAS